LIRVAWFVDQFGTGGTELNALRVAERLDRDQFDLQVLCLREQGPLLERYREMGVPVRRFPLRSLYAPSTLTRGLELRRYLRAGRFDVLHSHDVYSNIFALPFGRLAGVPLVLASRRWWKSPDSRVMRLANQWSSRCAHRILCNSRAVAEMIVREEGAKPDRVEIVWNFLEPEAFEAPSPEWLADRRAELGIDESTPVVGAVARLHPDKDHPNLVRAFAHLLATHPDARLVIVGGGPERDRIEQLARELGIAANVTLVGEQPSRPTYHHLFTVSVLSSWTEGFPNSLLEAMAARKAIVATRVVGTVDAVLDGKTGLLVSPRVPIELAAALGRVLDDTRLRETMADAGLERARKFFDAESSIASLEAIYRGGPVSSKAHLAAPAVT
jgi:glycosyltransferase involved in cell wall biosynthesis